MDEKNTNLKHKKSNKNQNNIIKIKTKNNKYSKLLAILPLSYIIIYVIIFPTNIVPTLRASIREGTIIPYPFNIGIVLFICGISLIPLAIIVMLHYLDL